MAAQRSAETTVFPTPVSVPVTKKRSGMHGAGRWDSRYGCARFINGCDQAANFLVRNAARQRKPDARRADGNRRRTYCFHGKSIALQLARDFQGQFICSEHHGYDVSGARATVEPPSSKHLAQRSGNFLQMRALRIRFASESRRCSNLSRQIRRPSRAENESSGPVHEVGFQRAAAADESAGACQRLSARVHHGKKLALEITFGGDPAAVRPANASRVSFVNDERGAKFLCQPEQSVNGRNIAFGAEH